MTKVIPILSGKAMIVEMPEGAINPHIHPGSNGLWYKYEGDKGGFSYKRCELPPGNWQIVGMLPEVTEEQAGMLVEKVMNGQHHQNYNYKSVIERWVKTALESLESAILVEGYYLDKNPYADNLRDAVDKAPSRDYASKLEEVNIFRQAQTRVLDRSRCLLLGREI